MTMGRRTSTWRTTIGLRSFWINDGRGHFRAIEKLALRKTSASSMSVDFADIDRDGYLDFFVNDMLSRDPRLRKREGFAQIPWQPRRDHRRSPAGNAQHLVSRAR